MTSNDKETNANADKTAAKSGFAKLRTKIKAAAISAVNKIDLYALMGFTSGMVIAGTMIVVILTMKKLWA